MNISESIHQCDSRAIKFAPDGRSQDRAIYGSVMQVVDID